MEVLVACFLAVNFPAFHPAGGRKDKARTSIFVLLKSLGDSIGRFILKKAVETTDGHSAAKPQPNEFQIQAAESAEVHRNRSGRGMFVRGIISDSSDNYSLVIFSSPDVRSL
jgi:hypothetical protein